MGISSGEPKRALLFANCQGEPLEKILRNCPDFCQGWSLTRYVNFTGDALPAGALENCDLFFYQHLGEKWKDNASARLLARLPAGARAVCLPNLFFKGYWPLWVHGSSMNFGDMFLDTLCDRGLGLAEIGRLYLHSVTRMYDLDELLARSLQVERERESYAFCSLVDEVLALWRERRLFDTVNHPAPELTWMLAARLMEHLGLNAPPPLAALEAAGVELCCDPEFELPIHPRVAEHFHLAFGHAGERFRVFGKMLTFEEYMACYVDCRRLGDVNFIDYLRAVKY